LASPGEIRLWNKPKAAAAGLATELPGEGRERLDKALRLKTKPGGFLQAGYAGAGESWCDLH